MQRVIQEYQKGQILLIVVLVMVTALTVGLSVAVRSVSNTKTTQDAANSEKAFSAAEAGIEQSLTSGSSIIGNFSNNATYKTTMITVAGTSFTLNNGSPVLKDGSVNLWLSSYPKYTSQWSGTFTLYWGQSTDVCNASEANNTLAALEILVFSGTTAAPQMARYDVDPCSQRSLNNKFQFISPSGGTVAGQTYSYSRTITVNQGLFVSIIPLYAPTILGVQTATGSPALPAQGTVIQAVGNANDTQRKIVTYRYYPSLPSEILQYSLFISQ